MWQTRAGCELQGSAWQAQQLLSKPLRLTHTANAACKHTQDAFRGLAGSTLNFVRFGKAVERIDNWYRRRGILGQVWCFRVCVGSITACTAIPCLLLCGSW